MNRIFRIASIALVGLSGTTGLRGAEAAFYRAINLNGPALTIDGRGWEAGKEAKDFKADGKTFENQKVTLKPAADTARAEMIRSSVWGDKEEKKGQLQKLAPLLKKCSSSCASGLSAA